MQLNSQENFNIDENIDENETNNLLKVFTNHERDFDIDDVDVRRYVFKKITIIKSVNFFENEHIDIYFHQKKCHSYSKKRIFSLRFHNAILHAY